VTNHTHEYTDRYIECTPSEQFGFIALKQQGIHVIFYSPGCAVGEPFLLNGSIKFSHSAAPSIQRPGWLQPEY
jgi:hypothetical protein